MIKFENTYSKLPTKFYDKNDPANFPNPELIIFNKDLAGELGIEYKGVCEKEIAQIFSGQKILEGSEPLSQAYAAYQFGHLVPVLGDGRAHLLGETNGFDIQLKGSGQSKFSRRGDGRSSLGPVIREYIVSEAMSALGVPTTRALAAVRSGEEVYRRDLEPGGIFTRVASSHIRVGTFQYFHFNNDIKGLKTLLDYTINRHYPELNLIKDKKEKCIAFIKAVIEKQAVLISHWMSLGFIHGVMNTDNFSIDGITIDYGPCAFIDEFSMDKVFSSIDQYGRYAYSNQNTIGQWNILRLADCLLVFIDEDPDKAAKIVIEDIGSDLNKFDAYTQKKMARKLGIEDYEVEDDNLISMFLEYLEMESLDFTLSFRNLPKLFKGDFKDYPENDELKKFLIVWKKRVKSLDQNDNINPLYIPRNHQIEKAIQNSFKGDYSTLFELIEVLKNPFNSNKKLDHYKLEPKLNERISATFCGT